MREELERQIAELAAKFGIRWQGLAITFPMPMAWR